MTPIVTFADLIEIFLSGFVVGLVTGVIVYLTCRR
jgi:hypothetical protein